jgi:hypothetical protein
LERIALLLEFRKKEKKAETNHFMTFQSKEQLCWRKICNWEVAVKTFSPHFSCDLVGGKANWRLVIDKFGDAHDYAIYELIEFLHEHPEIEGLIFPFSALTIEEFARIIEFVRDQTSITYLQIRGYLPTIVSERRILLTYL